ncbi:hypothetical protein llap_11588 [Limosa lapponica baueri]|uniref:Uncharacterized protein n=1 Tax=Limosa lapponica baueri TaxID=1758121 RepID=A0A2I0TWB5_LIMLA|nr:hypothetical protein llap_11588 [Limosa lapponica baueri]
MQTSLEQRVPSPKIRTCHCTQPTVSCSEEKPLGFGKPLDPKGRILKAFGLPVGSESERSICNLDLLE